MSTEKLKRGVKIAVGIALFAVIGIVLYRGISYALMPYQTNSIFTDKAKAFREEPRDTVEVLFLGPSTAADDFSPMRLYEQYGVCSYNLGTSQQPLLASYALAKEAYRLHPDTLKTIVLDCSVLRYTPPSGSYRLPLDETSFEDKAEAVLEWEHPQDELNVYLSPLYAYHNRWSSLTELDVDKLIYEPHGFLRGFEPSFTVTLADNSIDQLGVPQVAPDPSVAPIELDAEQVGYARELAEFCREKGITLVYYKTPLSGGWGDAEHNAIQALCDELGVAFLDANFEPFFSASGFNSATDTKDSTHANVRGANKITDYIGAYLMENGLATDVRGREEYAFLDDQLAQYHEYDQDLAEMRDQVRPEDYLARAISLPNHLVYVGIDGVGAGELTDGQREALRALGLERLASVQPGECYYAVIADGEVIGEDFSDRAEKRLYTCYRNDLDYAEPVHQYFKMFNSSDPEAIAAMAATTVKDAMPTWRFPDEGLICIVYDTDLKMVSDYAPFKANAHLERYANPQDVLDSYDAAGVDGSERSWFVMQLEGYNERVAASLAAEEAPPEEGASLEEVPSEEGETP